MKQKTTISNIISLVDNARSNISIIQDDFKKMSLLQMELCRDMFDKYKNEKPATIDDVAFVMNAIRTYSVYADIVQDYIIKTDKIIDTTDKKLFSAFQLSCAYKGGECCE